jgi:tRNA/rRNA methyltransferase
MGFTSLRLVNPCDHLSSEARKLAYGSHDVLESAKVYGSLEESIDDLDLVIATTAKNRTVWNDYLTPDECVSLVQRKADAVERVGIVFGREESGLTTEELELCDIRSTVPLAAPYPSINLAQSVMIYAYALSALNLGASSKASNIDANASEQKVLKHKAEELLDTLEITRNTNLSRRMMERLMLAGEDDIHLFLSFHRFLNQYIAKLKKDS